MAKITDHTHTNQDSCDKNHQSSLVDNILQYGKSAFDPSLPEETRRIDGPKFEALLNSTGILALMPALNLLSQPGRVQPWLRGPVMAALARLPLRPRGVEHTIEFVLSIHPSTAGDNSAQSTGRGASITHEAIQAVSRLLSSPPVGMAPEKWFSGISPQLFELLQGQGEQGLDKVAAFIIGFGILGRKQYGAPGTPGWRAFVDPILCRIDPTLVPSSLKNATIMEEPIITLGIPKILVSAQDVAASIQQLTILITSHPHPSLTKRLLRPILNHLWSLSSWTGGNDETEKLYRKPSRALLQSLIQLSTGTKDFQTPSSNILFTILQNLTFSGKFDPSRACWTYSLAENGGIQIEEVKPSILGSGLDLANIDSHVDSFVSLIETVPNLNAEISSLFMDLCGHWLSSGPKRETPSVALRLDIQDDTEDLETSLIQTKVMQKMMTAIPDKLIDNSRQVLDLVKQILSAFIDGNGNEDEVAVALSLFNTVLMSPSFRETSDAEALLESIKISLGTIGARSTIESSSTAKNLMMMLQFRKDFKDDEGISMNTLTDRQLEDRKTYNLAMSYITASDSPPPVRAQGLELILQLVRAKSSIVDVLALLVLFSSLLQDSESYIYLPAIRSFVELSKSHPKAVLKDLIDRYADPNEESNLDQRLRLGEALLQVIQNRSLAFSGDSAKSVCEGLLFIAGRRGYRPKLEKEQEKRNKLKRRKHGEAETAWGGSVPQLDEALDVESEKDYEIISQIVTGWESKRGMEDVRIRASALAILGSSIEANIEGIGSKLISTSVDISIHILTLEPEPEKGILRRTAILLILNFVRALDAARAEGRRLGFGLVGQTLEDIQRILSFVESTDNDGLVRQHARDTIEDLKAWQLNALIPPEREQTELTQLAGLAINPGLVEDSSGRLRPRIEEIE